MRGLFAVVLLCLSLAAGAADVENLGPEALVRQTSDRMIEMLKEQQEVIRAEPHRLYGFVHEIVLPHFDFERMARWVLGKHWRQAAPEQQQRFVDEFRTLLVRTYGTALLDYTNEKIVFLPLRKSQSADDVVVRTEVVKPGGEPIPINYSMHRGADGWKVYDVTIDGISLVSNYRADFSNQIATGGLDALIQKLAQRNAQGGK